MRGLGDAGRREEGLHELLVHGRRRGGHARADVGHRRQLEEPLHRPVLAVGPVQHGEVDVRSRRHLAAGQAPQARRRRSGLPREEDAPSALGRGRGRLLQPPASRRDRRARAARRAATGSPSATEAAERTLTSCSPERPPNSSATVERCAMGSAYARRARAAILAPRMFSFRVEALSGAARAGLLQTPHGRVETPAFMPVGTAGAVKAVTRAQTRGGGRADPPRQHLPPHAAARRRPGRGAGRAPRVHGLGGTLPHRQRRLPGLQPGRAAPRGRGRRLVPQPPRRHAPTGSRPERSMEVQTNLGADVVMAFDECPPGRRLARGGGRGHGADHALGAAQPRGPPPRGPVALRHRAGRRRTSTCASGARREIVALGFPGHAIGGLAVGETKDDTWRVVDHVAPMLPAEKPRYLMGVGTPEDLLDGGGPRHRPLRLRAAHAQRPQRPALHERGAASPSATRATARTRARPTPPAPASPAARPAAPTCATCTWRTR